MSTASKWLFMRDIHSSELVFAYQPEQEPWYQKAMVGLWYWLVRLIIGKRAIAANLTVFGEIEIAHPEKGFVINCTFEAPRREKGEGE